MISILLATHNGEKYLNLAIKSILEQTFRDFELLIGFNGTIDGSKEIVSNFKDNRIKTFDYVDNKGKSRTLNKLLQESQYDWVAIQDDDDVWHPDKLAKQTPYISEYDVIGTFIKYIDENNKLIGQPNLTSIPEEIVRISLNSINQVANSSTVIRKQAIIDVGMWDESLDKLIDEGRQPCEDYDLWLKMMRAKKTFLNIPEFLVLHRLHNNSKCNTLVYDYNKK
jgi:glycosyltransferase involved in cell wall biosynthesis